MKRLLLVLLLFTSFFSIQAQDKAEPGRLRYQGEVMLGAGFELESEMGYLQLEMINGLRINRYLSAGVGGGVSVSMGDEAFLFPIYVNATGHFPVAKKLDLKAGLNLGTKLDYAYGESGGFLLRPEFGIGIRFTERFCLNIALKYEFYTYRYDLIPEGNWIGPVDVRLKYNQIGLKLGFEF